MGKKGYIYDKSNSVSIGRLRWGASKKNRLPSRMREGTTYSDRGEQAILQVILKLRRLGSIKLLSIGNNSSA
ncbi:hypothetical protein C4D60_Mb00t03540 [Musa balbisiana]|uniref:Uncharacterized protein n=1 Tax=Musa balbisiana TaxID=52838 RepID=A0A4S8I5A1_MUSBA|nr:hypothetical protein C4D60_Mb00t03540 [Musa balbisiana]